MPNYNHFERVPGFKPNKSFFDLSHTVIQTGEMGITMPVQCDEVLPGDVWNSGNTAVVRLQPMITPLLDSLEVRFETFFVPYRLLWSKWEYFLTGTGPGQQPGQYEAPIPTVDKLKFVDDNDNDMEVLHTCIGTLWDYFHFPILSASNNLIAIEDQQRMITRLKNNDRLPLAFPWLAYTKIWNDWYRDEDLQEEIEIEDVQGQLRAFSKPFKRAWQKDYFTSARPWQQKGITPALPVTGYIDMSATQGLGSRGSQFPSSGLYQSILYNGATENAGLSTSMLLLKQSVPPDIDGFKTFWDNVPVTSTTFDVSDLRLAFQIQKFMELNSRSGSRYTEFLRSQYGSYPRDDRLDRAELIGTASQPVITSEILQTSATDATSPQGNMAGHGISVGKNHLTKYHVLESGLIMTLMTVMPKPNYSQGIDRQWLRRSRYDFYFPLFANLSEQGIENVELYADHDKPTQVFGFAGRWDEYRSKQNCLAGQMRTVDGSDVLFGYSGGAASLSYWHMSRFFKSKPALNADFIECTPRKDVFSVQNEPPLIISVTNAITAWRPLPAWSNPGLIDHM